jgi:hypothetical protein
MVLCWLVATKGLTPEEAFAFVKQKRRHISKNALRPVVYKFQKPQDT